VAFLKFEDEPTGGVQGAVFVTNAIGEPLEFAFSRVDVRGSVLWRPGDARRSAIEQVVRVLFPALASRPDCLLMLATEVPPRLFLDDIQLEIPACRVGSGSSVHAADEISEHLDDVLNLYWIGPRPGPDDRARVLIEALRARDLTGEGQLVDISLFDSHIALLTNVASNYLVALLAFAVRLMMEAGVSDHVWSVEDVIQLLDAAQTSVA